jgi:oligoendopeptidase F
MIRAGGAVRVTGGLTMKFKDMPYERIDLEALGREFDELTEKVKNADCAETVIAAFREQEKLSVHAQTMVSIASVRNSIDTRDEFYEAENEIYDLNLPAFEEHSQNLMLAVFESPYRAEVEKITGELMFRNLEMELKTFSPEIIEQLGEASFSGSFDYDFDFMYENGKYLLELGGMSDTGLEYIVYSVE